ncbi:MAG: biotin--[acetyl-CoA-carboxylase] ligase [Desulfatibacillum sp.]|nr:biotin--[acetyl-CoA-carboxylase] ligase [Desulfatibacillum sp.]
MKAKIIKLLKNANTPLSGEIICQDLGVSRVSVHKHINTLRERGYAITASSAGYTLDKEGDFLFPWEFEGRESLIHYFEETTSTMAVARDLAEKGCPTMTVAVAQRQTRGRGRLDRTWDSRDGGLYFTVVLRPTFPINQVYKVLFTASVCLAGVIRDLTGIEASVKWPNDILVGEKKLTGMLSEMATQDEFIQNVNLGIGVNVNNNPSSVEPNAVSIKELLGREFPRREILSGFLDRLESRLEASGEDVIALWKQYTSTLGRPVRIQTTRSVLEGTAVDVNSHGSLMVELADGSLEEIFHGDCFYRSGEA